MDGDIRVTFETEQKYELQHGSDYVVTVAPPAPAFEIVPYLPEHLRSIALQPHQEHLGAFLASTDIAERLQHAGPCWSALAFGRAIGCGGFEECWTGRAGAWAVLSDDAGRHMVRITRAVRRGLDLHSAERIETTVQAGFEAGMRWAKALGFEEEGLRRRYHDGHDHVAFVLLKTSQ